MWEPTIHKTDINLIVNIVEQISLWEEKHPDMPHHIQYLEERLDRAWEAMQAKQRQEWPGVRVIANQIERKLRKISIPYKKHTADTGSVYFNIFGKWLRVSDHARSQGGWHRGLKCYYRESEVQVTPFTGVGCKEAIYEIIGKPIFVEQMPNHPHQVYKYYERQRKPRFVTTNIKHEPVIATNNV